MIIIMQNRLIFAIIIISERKRWYNEIYILHEKS